LKILFERLINVGATLAVALNWKRFYKLETVLQIGNVLPISGGGKRRPCIKFSSFKIQITKTKSALGKWYHKTIIMRLFRQ
jgi:hypothetical protein